MTAPLLNSQAASNSNAVAADSHSLDQLRRLANQDPAKAVKQVATQFEALFMQMVLKSMRDATPKSGLLDSNEQQTYTGMLDEQLAQKIAAGGTGLADVIARQLSRNLPPTPAATAPSQAGGAPIASTGSAPGASVSAAPAVAPGAVAAGGRPAANLLQTIRAAQAVRSAK
jgi:flagellar protein FlgJ